MSRKNISIHQAIEERARDLIEDRACSGLSNLIEILIREEWERRHDAAAALKETSKPAAPAPAQPKEPVIYQTRRRPRVSKKDAAARILDIVKAKTQPTPPTK